MFAAVTLLCDLKLGIMISISMVLLDQVLLCLSKVSCDSI